MTQTADLPPRVMAVQVPLSRDTRADDLAERMRALRARIPRRRPDFLGTDGNYVDDQDLDYGAWHFIASRKIEGAPLGYVRMRTPTDGARQMFLILAMVDVNRISPDLQVSFAGAR
jgi:hypothetical protein